MANESQTLRVERIQITSEEQWKALRKLDVTASVVACLFGPGIHPYQTIAALHAEKSGIELPRKQSRLLQRGHDAEELVAKLVARERPTWKIIEANEYLRGRDPQRPYLRIGATPDRYIDADGEPAILQVKVVAGPEFKNEWTAAPDGCPKWIIAQALVEAMLHGASYGCVAALIWAAYQWQPPHMVIVPRNPAAERNILNVVEDFWRHVESGVQPQFKFPEDTSLLSLYWPHAKPGSEIDLRTDNQLAVELPEREKLLEEIATAGTRVKEIEGNLRAKIGDNERALLPGDRSATLKDTVRRIALPVDQLPPDKIRESRFRQLRVVQPKVPQHDA